MKCRDKMKLKFTPFFVLLLLLIACTDQAEQSPMQENNQKETEINEKEDPQTTEEIAQLPESPLQKQAQGEAVELLENALNDIGYIISTDGVYNDTITWAITDFQLQTNGLSATGIYDGVTKQALEELLTLGETIESGAALPPLTEPVVTNAGSEVLGNPYDILAVVNKENALPADYVPNDLVVPDVPFPFEEELPKKQLREHAAAALEELFVAAENAGHVLYAQSGYRSYERQVNLFAAYAENHGEEAANLFSARAGESEHQTGLSMDITSQAVGFALTTDFGDTSEGEWVSENAAAFGFIIRYPEGKETITEYQFEPWHLRYVGEQTALEITEANLTLEEYFAEE